MTPESLGVLSRAELVDMVLVLLAENRALVAKVEALQAQVGSLQSKVEALQAEAAKNSGNSPKPPSRDPVAERARQAEARRQRRKKAAGGEARKPGKQPGAGGTTLKMTDSPDEVIVHRPEVCAGCGGDLAAAEVTGVERRQVTEVPVIAPTVTEHQSERRRCGCCGKVTAGSFPAHVRAPVSYGPRVRAIVVYLLARQHIPVERAAEGARELFGVSISTGAVDAIYAEAGRRLTRFITALSADSALIESRREGCAQALRSLGSGTVVSPQRVARRRWAAITSEASSRPRAAQVE